MFEPQEYLSPYEKRLRRENAIRDAFTRAARVNIITDGNPTIEAVKEICPASSPRHRAMVRSIIVNGSVDLPRVED